MHSNTRQGYAWLPVIGVLVGWFMGISVSPVVSTVVGAVIASISAIIGAMAGISVEMKPFKGEGDDNLISAVAPDAGNSKDSAAPKELLNEKSLGVNPFPLALLLIGMFFGTLVGVYARTNNWLGPNLRHVISKWSDPSLPEAEIRRRLFDQIYPPEPSNSKEVKASEGASNKHEIGKPTVAGLFAISVEDCNLLSGRTGDELKGRLLLLNRPDVASGVKVCAGGEVCLEAIREVICASSQ